MHTIKLLPKELHALEINYIKNRLATLPAATFKSLYRNGKEMKYVYCSGHYYLLTAKEGATLLPIAEERAQLAEELKILQAAWDAVYFEKVPEMLLPHPVRRTFLGYGGQPIVLDREFYDSLTAESNPSHPEHKRYNYNGVYYRSKAEREIARTYTDLGIEFKYEPAVLLNSSTRYTFSDFVCWDRITQSCFFHEHMGLNSLADYAHKAVTAISNYTSAGVLPTVDIIYTFEDEYYSFDPELTVTQASLLIQNRLRNAYFPEAMP